MLSQLNVKTKRLLFSHGVFLLGRSAFQIFMNIFVWRLTSSITVVAWFNIIYGLSHTAIFVIFSDTLRRGRAHRVRKIGLIGFSLVYLSIFFLKENVQSVLYLYAILIGIFNGMYWLPYHLIRFDFTHIKNRGNYTGLERAVKTTVSFIAPIAGGYIISSNHFFSGYPSLFLIGVAFFFSSFFLGNVKISGKNNLKKISWTKTTKYIFSHHKVLKSFLATALSGFSLNGSLIRVVLPLLILQQINTEFELGGWLSVFALLSIVSSVILGRKISYRHYDQSVLIGGSIFISLFLLLYFFPIFSVFVLFGAVQEVAANMIHIPRRVYSENLLHTLPKFKQNRAGYLIIREVFGIATGTTLSYLLLLFGDDFSLRKLTLYTALIVLGVVAQIYLLLSVKYKEESFDSLQENT